MKNLRNRFAAALMAFSLWLMHGTGRKFVYSLRRLPDGVLRLDTWPEDTKVDLAWLTEGDPKTIPHMAKRHGPNHPDIEGRGW